jgi:alpha-beta hydrolase superfamily lysophospholipase
MMQSTPSKIFFILYFAAFAQNLCALYGEFFNYFINFSIFREKMMEYNIKLKNGLVLRGFIASPGEKSRAIIVFVHGLGEHIRRYKAWSDMLIRERIAFTGVDLPGHGRSDGKRGYIRSFALTDEMIDILLDSSAKTFPGVPVFLYGHSLGGAIVLDYILRKNPPIKGAIATAPWLRLAFEPPKVKLMLASVMKNLLPGLLQPSGLVTGHLSRDTEVVEQYKADPLVHDRISVSLFHSGMSAARNSLANASELNIPVLLMHGSDDKILSPEGSREFEAKTNLAELKIWDGLYHEIHNEPLKGEVFAYLVSWISKKLT